MNGKQTAIVFTVVTIVCAIYSYVLLNAAEPDALPASNLSTGKP